MSQMSPVKCYYLHAVYSVWSLCPGLYISDNFAMFYHSYCAAVSLYVTSKLEQISNQITFYECFLPQSDHFKFYFDKV